MRCRNEVIITAAGSSKRIGDFIKKEYFLLHDKPILFYSIEAFLKSGVFSRIIVTIPDGDNEQVKNLLAPFFDLALIKLVTGGATRQESVYAGLLSIADDKPDNVLIHDGARPWVEPALILDVIRSVQTHGSGIPLLPAVDSLVEVDETGCIHKTLNRDKIKAVQTPQGFQFTRIMEAHRYAKQHAIEAPDDSTLYRLLYAAPHSVPGDFKNIKITYKRDLGLCE